MYESHHVGEKHFKKPNKKDLNDILFGSAVYIQTNELDKKAINTAIIRCLMPYAWKIEEYSNYDAARDVVDELREAGFTKIYRTRSIIFQNNVKFKVIRHPDDMDVFVTVEEKLKYERGQSECHYLIK